MSREKRVRYARERREELETRVESNRKGIERLFLPPPTAAIYSSFVASPVVPLPFAASFSFRLPHEGVPRREVGALKVTYQKAEPHRKHKGSQKRREKKRRCSIDRSSFSVSLSSLSLSLLSQTRKSQNQKLQATRCLRTRTRCARWRTASSSRSTAR